MVISKQRWNVTKQNFSVPHIYAPGRSEEIGVPSNLYWYISRDVLQVRALKCEKRVHPSEKRSNFKNTGANACRLFWKSRLTSTANYEKTGTIPPHSIIMIKYAPVNFATMAALVQMMFQRWTGAKPSPQPIATYRQLDRLQWRSNQNTKQFLYSKMSMQNIYHVIQTSVTLLPHLRTYITSISAWTKLITGPDKCGWINLSISKLQLCEVW